MHTTSVHSVPIAFMTRVPSELIASIERSSGVFSSSAAPVHVMNDDGM